MEQRGRAALLLFVSFLPLFTHPRLVMLLASFRTQIYVHNRVLYITPPSGFCVRFPPLLTQMWHQQPLCVYMDQRVRKEVVRCISAPISAIQKLHTYTWSSTYLATATATAAEALGALLEHVGVEEWPRQRVQYCEAKHDLGYENDVCSR